MATIILAGGSSARMGREKALLEMNGTTIVQRLVSRFARALGPVIVVCRSDQDLQIEGATVVHDIHEGAGPLGGLHAGLLASPDDANLLLGCDMPFADPELGCHLVSLLGDHDAVACDLGHGPEPLFAAYRKSCLTQIESNLRLRLYRMKELLDRIDVLYLSEDEVRARDPHLRSFVNLNTPDEYLDALKELPAS